MGLTQISEAVGVREERMVMGEERRGEMRAGRERSGVERRAKEMR